MGGVEEGQADMSRRARRRQARSSEIIGIAGVVAVLVVGFIVPQAVSDTAGWVAFTDVTVVPMDRERLLERRTVLVRGDRIEAIGAADSIRMPAGTTRVDGRQKYLMPGIAEMHAHVPGEDSPAAVEIMALYALTGATTIRGMLGTPYQHELRRRIESREILGPTLFTVAPPFSGNSTRTADEARRKVREYSAAGYHVLKIFPPMSRDVYDAITSTAREVGIPYAGHVPPEVGLRHAIEERQSVEHLDGYVEASRGDERAIADLARATREAGIWNSATMDVWKTSSAPDRWTSFAAVPSSSTSRARWSSSGPKRRWSSPGAASGAARSSRCACVRRPWTLSRYAIGFCRPFIAQAPV